MLLLGNGRSIVHIPGERSVQGGSLVPGLGRNTARNISDRISYTTVAADTTADTAADTAARTAAAVVDRTVTNTVPCTGTLHKALLRVPIVVIIVRVPVVADGNTLRLHLRKDKLRLGSREILRVILV